MPHISTELDKCFSGKRGRTFPHSFPDEEGRATFTRLTNMTDTTLLKKPFEAGEIKQREGAGRQQFSYVDHENVLSRVMEATGDVFDWQIIDCGFHPSETYTKRGKDGNTYEATRPAFFWCRGRLTIPDLGTREGYGTQVWENEDSPKGSETDSFKRAAMRFGVALHLYEKPDNAEPPQRNNYGQQGNYTRPAPTSRPDVPTASVSANSVGQCPECFAPDGKPHAKTCKAAYGLTPPLIVDDTPVAARQPDSMNAFR